MQRLDFLEKFVIMLFAAITLSLMLTGCHTQKEDPPSAKDEALEMMGKIEHLNEEKKRVKSGTWWHQHELMYKQIAKEASDE